MKTLLLIGSMILLAGITGVQAQSGGGGNLSGNTGQQGSSPQNNGMKANTSQTMGKGVPFNKDAEQQGRMKNKSGKASTPQYGTKQGGMLPKNSNVGTKSGKSPASN